MSASVAFWNTSSTSSFVTPCSAQCWTLPSGSSSRSQMIESNGMTPFLLACGIIIPKPDTQSQAVGEGGESVVLKLVVDWRILTAGMTFALLMGCLGGLLRRC